jgi:xanthine/CO dehydrogenase XdhC/CoxF family maturation factor
MTHELRKLIQIAALWQKSGKKVVLATVVDLEGSSYRRPGVRMILSDQGEALGAVSGGCVEKEILSKAQSVFRTGKARIMSYDGRYRVGCDGLLYILLEPFETNEKLLKAFEAVYKDRKSFQAESWYYPEPGEYEGIGSVLDYLGIAEAILDLHKLQSK